MTRHMSLRARVWLLTFGLVYASADSADEPLCSTAGAGPLLCLDAKNGTISPLGAGALTESLAANRAAFNPEVGTLFTPSTVVADTPTQSALDCQIIGRSEMAAPAAAPAPPAPLPPQYLYQPSYQQYPPSYYPSYSYSYPSYFYPPTAPVYASVPPAKTPLQPPASYRYQVTRTKLPAAPASNEPEPLKVTNPHYVYAMYHQVKAQLPPKNPLTVTPESICIDRPKRQYVSVRCCKTSTIPLKPAAEKNPLGELLENCACPESQELRPVSLQPPTETPRRRAQRCPGPDPMAEIDALKRLSSRL